MARLILLFVFDTLLSQIQHGTRMLYALSEVPGVLPTAATGTYVQYDEHQYILRTSVHLFSSLLLSLCLMQQ